MIIGTAGHIDHGKTALIKCLTGIDTDRLPEEKQREMTIELGFAHLDLEGTGRTGIVDVPGHERFIHTMVAGATGIDLVLLVVAADDGVMPQTREHLDIINLLGVQRGVIALNKIDLVDEKRATEVKNEIRELLQDTPLHDAPIVPVSAHTGDGVESLRQALINTLKEIKAKQVTGYFRLAVDRVFTMPGFGLVVTGTVASGQVKKGDHLTLLPGSKQIRVRGLQSHNIEVETVTTGERCALNLTGVSKQYLHRGMMVCDPCLQRSVHTVDVSLTLVQNLNKIPKSHKRIRLHSGAAETFARLVWLEDKPVAKGQTGLAQLRLEEPVPLLYGDRFIVRNESAQQTLGGGLVLDPFAHRRGTHHREHIARLQHLCSMDADQRLQLWLEARGVEGWRLLELAEQLAEPPEQIEQRLTGKEDVWRVDVGGHSWLALKSKVEVLIPRLLSTLDEYLKEHPRVTAMPLATLHAKVCPRLELTVFRALVDQLVSDGLVKSTADGLHSAGHQQQFTAAELSLAERIESTLAFRGKTPPKLEALARAVGKPVKQLMRFLGELERAGRVIQITRGVYLTNHDFKDWQERALNYLQHNSTMTLAQFRDEIGCGRELAMQVLELFDSAGVTRREDNVRVLAGSPKQEIKHA
jgi:selenocysteine-specific elongation factor